MPISSWALYFYVLCQFFVRTYVLEKFDKLDLIFMWNRGYTGSIYIPKWTLSIGPFNTKFDRNLSNTFRYETYRRTDRYDITIMHSCYGLDDQGSGVRFPEGIGTFSLHHRVQNGSFAHPASYPMGTRRSFPGSKAAGAWSLSFTSI
jgi:hypothetical protein